MAQITESPKTLSLSNPESTSQEAPIYMDADQAGEAASANSTSCATSSRETLGTATDDNHFKNTTMPVILVVLLGVLSSYW